MMHRFWNKLIAIKINTMIIWCKSVRCNFLKIHLVSKSFFIKTLCTFLKDLHSHDLSVINFTLTSHFHKFKDLGL